MFRPALLLVLLAFAATASCKEPCDDQMGGDSGAGLRLIPLPRPRRDTPPAAQAWVGPLVAPLVKQGAFLKSVYTFGGAKPAGCTLKTFTYSKLCVPKDGKPGNFRVKVSLVSSCGTMNIKMRLAVAGNRASMTTWGRSAS